MTSYHPHKINLSEGQRNKLLAAYKNKSEITLRLSNSDLTGKDELMLTQRQINKLKEAKLSGVGSDLKISKTQIRKVLKTGQGALKIGMYNSNPKIGMYNSTPKTRSRRSTTTKNNTTTLNNISTSKKDGGKLTINPAT